MGVQTDSFFKNDKKQQNLTLIVKNEVVKGKRIGVGDLHITK